MKRTSSYVTLERNPDLFTIDYIRKLAKQVLVNDEKLVHRAGGDFECVAEDLAQHIYAGGSLNLLCFDKVFRKLVYICSISVWSATKQGYEFWDDIYNLREPIPEFTGERQL